MNRPVHLSRRALLAAGGGLGVSALLAACGVTGDTGSGSGSWTFTDDRGVEAKTDGTPERIVAFVGVAAALHDMGLGDKIVGVFGPTVKEDGSPDSQAGDLDVDKLEILGNAWGEFNIEKYAALKPDLLVSNIFSGEELWYVPAESADKIAELAPSVGIITSEQTLTKPIERFAELAEALGADLKSEANTAAKQRFDTAAQALSDAAEANPVKVLACSADADLFYASSPEKNCDLRYYTELGLGLIKPENLNDDGYFEELSWENADTYPADLLMLDNRSAQLQPDDLADKPAWRDLPAVQADQVIGWPSEPRYSYAGCAPLIEDITEAVTAAKPVT